MTETEKSDSALMQSSDDHGRYIFAIEPLPDGRYQVSCWREGCWRGAVRANTLEDAAASAVQWHITGELG